MTTLLGPKVRYYSFTGPIGPEQATRLGAAFSAAVNEQCDEVYLCLNSPGGLVGDGIFLYNLIRGLPLRTTIHNVASVSSIATAVFVAAERRLCSPHSTFLVHPTTIGPFQEAVPSQRLELALQSALADDQRIEDILRNRTALPDEMLTGRRIKDIHITPQIALKHGLVHGIEDFALPKGNQIFQV